MTGFFTELGKQLVQRWFSLLVLPGLLFVAVAGIATVAGHRHALDAAYVWRVVAGHLARTGKVSVLAVVTIAVALLLASVAVGLVVQALAIAVERWWLGMWPAPLRRWGVRRTERRARRWQELSAEIKTLSQALPPTSAGRDGTEQTRRTDLARARNRISGAPPQRPTWIGDRMMSVDTLVHAEYGIDLPTAWPRLWLIVSPEVRGEIRAAREAFDRSCKLGGWGILYLLLTPIWWPALLLGVGAFYVATVQARTRIGVLADLIEALVDLHLSALAAAVIRESSDLTPAQAGHRLTSYFRKGR